jgi:hypothetical protein
VASEDIVANYTAATDAWPRVTSLITSAGGNSQLLVLTQEDPRSDYKLWSQTQLTAGTKLPELPDSRQGAKMLEPGSKDFVDDSGEGRRRLREGPRQRSGLEGSEEVRLR